MPLPPRRTRTAVAALAALALTAGCGTDEPSTAAPTSSTSAAPGAPTAQQQQATAPSTVTVRVEDMTFSPDELRVQVGDTVTWEFADGPAHSVQGIGDSAMGINSPIQNAGSWSYTFIAPGNYRYLCSLHPEMRGTVVVEE
ncbi:plastocyanin/azurin family copper-binding protein [Nocardia sp. NPDC057353]|uniref:plastocyanin/azurin family copper-binding protein n=1 Tax=Nocardia sp. NPDC057353 TaxID=3346104 RepID=UPI0036413B0C